jgi:integrase
MHLRQRGKIWYGTVYDEHGNRDERSTGCTDKAAARAVLASWEREAADPDRAAAATTLNDALTLLLEDRAARVTNGDGSEETVSFYKKKSGHLVRVFGHDFRIALLKDAAPVWRYIDTRRAEGMLDTSIEREVTTLRAALRIAKERGQWKGDVDAIIPDTFDPIYKPKTRSPTRAEVLRILPHMLPDGAAAVAFILATSAEDSALHRALREDIPTNLDVANLRVHVRGSKNDRRDRWVPIVSDEQRLLWAHAATHAQGAEGKLFRSLGNLRHELLAAAKKVAIEPLSPHALRKAAGQWLIDLGVPLELVSRVLGHADTRITETVYAKIKDADVTDRMLDAIDPRYAKKAHRARGAKKIVETIKKLPAPRTSRVLYEVGGVERTLVQWAETSGISKTTLFHRVITSGMTMADALSLAKGTKGKRLPGAATAAPVPQPKKITAPKAKARTARVARTAAGIDHACASFDSEADGDCRTGAADRVDSLDALDTFQVPSVRRSRSNPLRRAVISVPRDRIELPTRGFSKLGGSQKQRRLGPCLSAAAAPVPQKAKIVPVLPRRPAPESTKKRGRGSKLAAVRARCPLPVATPRKRRGSVLRTADTDG